MNPKSALFISASLTAFVVAVLFGVVTKISNTDTQTVAAAPAAQVEVVQNTATATAEQPTDVPTATAQTPTTPDEAAMLAAAAINRQDVYSVETSTYQGANSYKVVFSSGDVVYIGLDKSVLAKTKLAVSVASVVADPAQAPVKHHKNKDSSNNNSPSPKPDHSEHDAGHDD